MIHLLLVVIAYGKNNNFEKAPEEALRNKGIVTYITDIDEINDMIMEMIAKYPYVTCRTVSELKNKISQEREKLKRICVFNYKKSNITLL